MTDAKPALGSHETFERACNALHLEVDGSIAESVRAIGRAALHTERAARLAAEARVKELEAAGIALYKRWQQFTVERGGWGNQENAYYDLAKHAQHEWNALRAALKEPANG